MDTKLLKQKILDLAIHGKLVPQNPNDEPASKLLEKIREEKQKLIAAKKIKADKNDSYIYVGDDNRHYEKFSDGTVKDIEDEIPFEVPEGWAWCRLGILSETTDYIANGSFADTRENVHFYKEENYALLVKTQDFNNNFTEDLTFTDKQGYDFLSKSHLFGGELLLSNIGASIGKALIVPYLNRPMAVAPNSIIVRTKGLLNTEYLRYMMLSSYGQKSLMDFTSGSAMPKFNKTQLRSLLVALPSPKIQKNILEAIQNIFDKIDSIETDKTDLQTAIKHAKSKILDLAIHGKLVPQDSSDEPASVLLERLRAEKEAKIKAGKLKRDKNDSYIYNNTTDNCYYEKFQNGAEEMIEVPYDLPESWTWVKIGNLFTINPKVTGDDEKDASFIPMERISPQNKNVFSFETAKWGKIKKNHTQFKDGDVCFAKISPCFENGKAFIAKDLVNGIGAGTTELIVLRNEYIEKKYTFYFLANPIFIHECCATFNGVVGQQRIGTDIIRNYFFPVPPLNEQKRIVEKIEYAFTQLDEIILNLV